MTSENNNQPPHDAPDAHDELMGRLINEFFDRRARGETLSKDAFLAEHAEHADDLREHLAGLEFFRPKGSSDQAAHFPGDETIDARRGSSTAEALEAASVHIPKIEGYEIHRMIGRGGMGVVYKATQISTKRQVALKVLLEGPLASEQARKRFEREIEVAAQLRHSNIIPIYDSGKSDGRMYYAMAYVRGVSLSDFIATRRPTLDDRLRLFVKICQAVRHAHQRGVMHRDLKPTNVLVDSEGEPHILDFGLAKISALSDVTMSVTAQIVGTPAYMSPEQAAGDPSGVDTRTDIYSLGVVLYEMLTGRMPYDTSSGMAKLLEHIANTEPPPPNAIERKISGELSAIVMKALEKSRDRRYQSLDVFQSDVENFLAGAPISVRPATAVYLIKKTLWRHRIPLGFVAAIVTVGVGVTTIMGHYSRRLHEQKQEIARDREQLKRDKDDLQRERDIAAIQRDQREKELRDTIAFLERVDPALADAAKTIAGGVANPYRLPEIIARSARDFTHEGVQVPSKIETFNPDAPIRFEPPAVSMRPQAPTIAKPDYLNMLGQAVQQVFIPGLPEIMSKAAGQGSELGATSRPADKPTTQPSSSSSFKADAGKDGPVGKASAETPPKAAAPESGKSG